MNCDYSKVCYLLNEDNLNNVLVSYNYYGTIFYLSDDVLYYLNLDELDKYYELFNNNIKVYINNKILKLKKPSYKIDFVNTKINLINWEPLPLRLNNSCINKYNISINKYNISIIICVFINKNTDLNYIQSVINQFELCNTFIIYTTYGEMPDAFGPPGSILIKINEDNHMAGYLQALNYIYCYELQEKYEYIFKLYYHESQTVNQEIFNFNKDMLDNNISGYPIIKFDYLDSTYLFDIIKQIPNHGIKTQIIKNINNLKTNDYTQINRNNRIFNRIIKKTKIIFIPSGIYITKTNKINFAIIDLYKNLESIYSYNFELQSYTNALNKFICLINI